MNTLFEKFSPHLDSVVICLGCTGLVGQAKRVQDHLGVPVLDPVLIGLKMAGFKAALWKKFGISHSKIGGYQAPLPY